MEQASKMFLMLAASAFTANAANFKIDQIRKPEDPSGQRNR
jgi:hypothetical protein